MKILLNVNGKRLQLYVPPLERRLDVLRADLGLTAAKEGCGEGECGACAVIMDGRLVDSCLVPAFQTYGRSIRTAEGLGDVSDPDPVQKAFVEGGAVQCGFCTPGMAMAARALLDVNPSPDRNEIRIGLSGNLCRCTGYERIIQSVERAAKGVERPLTAAAEPPAAASSPDGSPAEVLSGVPADDPVRVFFPADLDEALALLAEHGPALEPVAGATDFSVETELGLKTATAVLDISRLPRLRGIREEAGSLIIGGAVTFAELAMDPLAGRLAPSLVTAAMQVGAPAVRNRATLAGNIVTGSPCADSVPPLMAMGAEAVLSSAGSERVVPLDGFYLGYRETALRCGELLTAIRVPAQPAGARQFFFKAGARLAQSIAKVSLAARIRLDSDRTLRDVRIAAGSVAPTVILLTSASELLEGRVLDAGNLESVAAELAAAVAAEVAPIDDVRSTADYRRRVAGNLAARFLRGLPV